MLLIWCQSQIVVFLRRQGSSFRASTRRLHLEVNRALVALVSLGVFGRFGFLLKAIPSRAGDDFILPHVAELPVMSKKMPLKLHGTELGKIRHLFSPCQHPCCKQAKRLDAENSNTAFNGVVTSSVL